LRLVDGLLCATGAALFEQAETRTVTITSTVATRYVTNRVYRHREMVATSQEWGVASVNVFASTGR
jgi:hypothetical protein